MKKQLDTNLPGLNLSLAEIWSMILQHKRLIVVFTIGVTICTFIGTLFLTPQYKATTRLQLRQQPGQEAGVKSLADEARRGTLDNLQFYRTEIQVMKSKAVCKRAANKLLELCAERDRLGVEPAWDCSPFEPGESGSKGSNLIRSLTSTSAMSQTRLIDISVQWSDPELAAAIANVMAESYIEYNLESRRSGSASATTWLENKLSELGEELDTTNREVFEFKEIHGMADLEEQQTTLSASIEALNEAYGQKSTARVLLETSYNEHLKLLQNGQLQRLARYWETPILNGLLSDIIEARAEDSTLAKVYGPKHPKRVQNAEQIASLTRDLDREFQNMLAGEQTRLSVVREEEQALKRSIDDSKRRLLEYQKLKSEFGNLLRERQREEEWHKRLSGRLDELRLSAQTQLSNVQIMDLAIPPGAPFAPRKSLYIFAALILGVIGGMVLALIKEIYEDSIDSPKDVTLHLRSTFLGFIPEIIDPEFEGNLDMYNFVRPRSTSSESVRNLRAMLEMHPEHPPPRRLVVTSSLPREGKTSTCCHLAISYAHIGKRVVLIDTDLRRPRLHHSFNLERGRGVVDVMLDGASILDVVHETEVPGLFFISAGRRTERPADLLSEAAFEQFLKDLEEHFDMVIMDSPPSVALVDTITMSRLTDGIMFVVRASHTPRHVIRQTIEKITRVNAPFYGVVLNNVKMDQTGTRSRWYYGYNSYYYQSDEPDGEPTPPEPSDSEANTAAK